MFYVELIALLAWNTPCHDVIHGFANTPNTFLDMLLFGRSKAQTDIELTSTIDVKWLTNNKGHLLMRCFPQQGACTHVNWQATPQVKATSWAIDAHTFTPVGMYRGDHSVAFLPVANTEHCQMVIK